MPILLVLLVGLIVFFDTPVQAEHRATRLGYPSTRFAYPLTTPEDLRERFRNPKLVPDIEWVMKDWGWKGDTADLFKASQTAPIVPWEIPIEGRMPFMTTRRNGKPVVLRDVVWVGEKPVPAFAFEFISNGRRYRCITPKACSNFFVEDLGPYKTSLRLTKSAPQEASVCEPFEVVVTVVNPSPVPATQVRIVDALPPGLKTLDGQNVLSIDTGTLKPGAGMEYRFKLVSSVAGVYTNFAGVTCAEGVSTNASAVTTVHAPILTIDCGAPKKVIAGRAAQVCFKVSNTGDAAEPNATLTVPVPEGAEVTNVSAGGTVADGLVVWQIVNLAPGANQNVCAAFTLRKLGSMAFTAKLVPHCAPPAESQCATAVIGVPGVLMEVVDLEDPIQVGEQVTYDIKITNQGFADITNTRVVCIVPDSQEFISGTGSTPVHFQDGKVVMDAIPLLVPKEKVAWQVVMRAKKDDDVRFNVELRADQFEEPIHEAESTRQY